MSRPSRYKVFYGGRGSAKSWSIARELLVRGLEAPIRVLCAREFQSSIDESVLQLLRSQILDMGLEDFYRVQKNEILGSNGTYFGFEGLKLNVKNLKSWEGADYCWIEEADTISNDSLDILTPTIRKDGSEIWLSFNPTLEDDPVYKRFVLTKRPDCVGCEVNWRDNPFFPEVLRSEMEYDRANNPDKYLHVWEGKCKQALEGAVYAAELRKADAESRITDVPYNDAKPVDTFWDLGYRDSTAIWCIQQIGAQTRVIDYMEGSQKKLADYVKELQARPYVWGTDYVPHDAAAKELGVGLSLNEQLQALNRTTAIVPRVHQLSIGIEALRSVFGSLWFDRTKCAIGINHLRRYRYVTNTSNVTGREPLHDAASHAADALRQFGQMSQQLASAGVWAKMPTVRRRVL